jgi:hypothetical protein
MGNWLMILCAGVAIYAGVAGWALYAIPVLGALLVIAYLISKPQDLEIVQREPVTTIALLWASNTFGVALFYSVGLGAGYLAL